ncbi:hypothetical protein ASZ90_017118 [hydrocarbon metagenome]|uniref:Copper amine oxidase-like N-terminal domain-containing protein n=1 Tax=hydrocarbon metagenome TaxID=938273 RepID=A0A0W8EA92_9ZZZZ
MGFLSKKVAAIPIIIILLFMIPAPVLAAQASFTLAKSYYTVDDVYNGMDAVPFISNSRFFVPVRYTALVCGISQDNITWDNANQIVSMVSDDGTEIRLKVGLKKIYVADMVITMDVAPINVNGRVYLPIRYIAEAMQRKVAWDANTMTVTVQMEDYLTRALEEIQGQRYDAAIGLCDKLSEISPNSSSSLVIRGVAQYQQADYEGAIVSYDKAVEVNPYNEWAYVCRAEARWPLYLQQTDKEIAINAIIDDVSKAIELTGDQMFYFRRAGLYNYMKDYDRAIADCDKAISLDDQYQVAYYRRAISYCLRDGNDAFIRELTAILDKFPGDEWAVRSMNLLNSGVRITLDVSDW